MTQWVFRAQSCNCENPVLNNPTMALRAAAVLAAENNLYETQKATFNQELENPLEVDPGKFPSDRYVPLAIVGDGQHGIVYKAHDRLLKRVVAIKTVRTSRLTPEQLVQFQSEAKATSQLNHPNVIGLFDFGVTSDGVPFLVMEYFEGETLQDIIKANGPLPVTSGIFVLIQACAGLQHAHEKRILHRDLKSSNILIGTIEGRMFLKILDFGLSSLISQSPNDGSTTSLRGTPTYMSPEQVRELAVDERSDMYSLGCMAYEIFVGRVPFKEENALATMMKHVDGVPDALTVANPSMEFNEDIEFIVAKTLEKNPDDRYRTVDDLKQALQSVRFPERETSKPGKTSAISIPTSSTLTEEHAHGKAATQKSLVLTSVLIIAVAAAGVYLALSGIKPQAPDVPLHIDAIDNGHAFVNLDKELRAGKNNSAAISDGKPVKESEEEDDEFDASFVASKKGPGSYENPNATDKTLAILTDGSKFSEMRFLSLRGSGVEGPGLKYLINRPALQSLTLSQAPIRSEAFDWISKMHLKDLSINYTRIPSKEYRRLRPAGLLVLDIDSTAIDDTAIDAITTNIKTLTKLSMRDNPALTNNCLSYLPRLKDLEWVNVSECKLSGAGFKSLRSVKKLAFFIASQVPVFDDDLDPLLKLPLTHLELSGRHLTEKGLKKLETLKTQIIILEETSHISAKAKTALYRKHLPNRVVFMDGIRE